MTPILQRATVGFFLGALCAFARVLLSSFETFVSFVVKIFSPRRARSTRSLDRAKTPRRKERFFISSLSER